MTPPEFSLYLPPARETTPWGATVTAAGSAHTRPGAAYPSRTGEHPADHLFHPERGRVLDAWQILIIHDGRGWFESEPTGRIALHGGSTFLLFPGLRHRYAPDPQTGWSETWFEFEGVVPDQLRENGTLDPQRAVHDGGLQPGLLDAVERGRALLQRVQVDSAALAATTVLEILAHWIAARDGTLQPPGPMDNAVRRARSILSDLSLPPCSIRSLSQEVGVAESHFRRVFRAQTGLSPKQYQSEVRLRRVRSLLRNSALTISEIADQLGYSSPYHLSTEFKKHCGESPSDWRKR